ncbi:MAG: carboxymuconolactone decarboxylase family protein [Candidatus Eremiobacteraeota bacterium]|nr:carboxymuconolactone decarboxylase family protein [Candidatus Eremiobacteraeota bacterium]MBC5802365.1 carboxymuconolactone decarboxylase family protein [Candidatus Eremiobacteraeota bacterium]MBC5820583.1 carboxymuconolactone decarboxylase family protein [Candidatus Eremiobacteraeota bacterium]
MEQRWDFAQDFPKGMKALLDLEQAVAESGIEPSLLHLVKMRASILNGCAYCIDMHTKDARAAGETEQRLYELAAWRETSFYSERERAALAWTEAITRIAETHAPDDVYEGARKHFSRHEIAALTAAIAAINTWNRLAIASRTTPGTYRPAADNAAVGATA